MDYVQVVTNIDSHEGELNKLNEDIEIIERKKANGLSFVTAKVEDCYTNKVCIDLVLQAMQRRREFVQAKVVALKEIDQTMRKIFNGLYK